MADPTYRRVRYLVTARVVGVAALGTVGQVAVDMPEGYFGAADRMTTAGVVYSCGLALVAAAMLLAARSGLRIGSRLAAVTFSASIGLFLPALTTDPMIAGLVVGWNVVLLAQSFLPQLGPQLGEGLATTTSKSAAAGRWLEVWGPAMRHLSFVAIALTIAVVGYRLSDRGLTQMVCGVLGYSTLALSWPFLRNALSEGRRTAHLVLLPAAASAVVWFSSVWMLSLLATSLVALLALLLRQQQTIREILQDFSAHPSRLVVSSFLGAIGLGTVLLTFPAASADAVPLHPVDALFTATSATCVTGLIVLDTPHAFSTFGHLVILGLIQMGGLGIMTLSTFATLLLGGSLSLRGERALTEMLDVQHGASALRLTRFIVASTLAVEAVGAVGLGFYFRSSGSAWGDAVWRGVFHSVSAFCNAGFALQSDSVVMFQRRPGALLIFAALIVFGGLGFAVLAEGWTRLRVSGARPPTVQVRLVLTVSTVLVLAGTVLFAGLEWNRSLAGLPVVDKLVNALFQSVTQRTAGFNSVDFAPLSLATMLCIMLFMFIGASPGSTGGGIKTTTAAVILAGIRSTLRPGGPIRLFNREVPPSILLRSLAIAVISAAIIFIGAVLLVLFEPQPLESLLFEAVSAFGTVGLSLGATAELGPVGKLIVTGVMFAGRTGPLTLALLLGMDSARVPRYRYPETRLMVG